MLTTTLIQPVKFNQADPLGIVWHGHYIQYFEDGREDFGAKYQLSYLDIFQQGFVIPIVNVKCDFKKPLRYGDIAEIRTTFIPTIAAKLIFNYEIYNHTTKEIVANGSTTQVFLKKENLELHLIYPDFIIAWQKKYLTNG